MEFNKKLQELRRQRKLTQEELSEALFVSRTAISKWESGRGYPNIESLKAIAKFFSVSVDELLSGEELLGLAEENQKQKMSFFRDLTFGFLDILIAMLFFLPIFAERHTASLIHVSLLSLENIQWYLRASYFALIILIFVFGISTLALQNFKSRFWIKMKSFSSLILSTLAVFVFILSLQAYAAIFAFALLLIKAFVFIKTN